MLVCSNFGIRLTQEEVQDIIAKHLDSLGYSVNPSKISIVPLTNSKSEFIVRSYQEKSTVPLGD